MPKKIQTLRKKEKTQGNEKKIKQTERMKNNKNAKRNENIRRYQKNIKGTIAKKNQIMPKSHKYQKR